MNARGYETMNMFPRYLPLTTKSGLWKCYLLTKVCLTLPVRPFGRQQLLFSKKGVGNV
jgi:hypothetical protein